MIRLNIKVQISIILFHLYFLSTGVHANDLKIHVWADTHVMAPSLLDTPDNKEWKEYAKSHKTMQDISAPLFDVLTEQIIQEKPDILLIVGDITKDGEVESHDYALKNLTKIKNSGIKLYVIPGNHDRGWMQHALKYDNDTCQAAETIDNDGFEEYYAVFGYGKDTERYGNTLSYMAEPCPGLTLLCLDSGIWCTFREGCIDWVCEKAKAAQKKGNQVIVLMHHLLMPHYYYQNSLFELSIPTDYAEIRQKFMNAGIKVVLTGHTHTSDITRYVDTSGKEIYDIGNGSPISYPCDYRILTFNESFTELKITTKSLTEFNGYEDFPKYAKDHLRESVINWARKWFKEKLPPSETSNNSDDDEKQMNYDEDEDEESNLLISVMSRVLANCFTIHAEGNEADNPKSEEDGQIFNDLLQYISRHQTESSEIIENVSRAMKSVLGDYPSETDKDNIVNDRELILKMPVLSNSIEDTVFEEDTEKEWFTLQGLKLPYKPSLPGIYICNGKKIIIN